MRRLGIFVTAILTFFFQIELAPNSRPASFIDPRAFEELDRKLQTLVVQIPQARADYSMIPINFVDVVKSLIQPLTDVGNCEAGGGIVQLVLCRLTKKLGVVGVGDYEGLMYDNFYRVYTTTGADGYEYKSQAGIDSVTQDGTNYDKFMNYWFSKDGKIGKLEIFPFRGTNDANTLAISMTWDSTAPTTNKIMITAEKVSRANSIKWDERIYALRLDFDINTQTGRAEIAGGINAKTSDHENGGFVGFKIRMVRKEEYTLAQAVYCDGDINNCSDGNRIVGGGDRNKGLSKVQCIKNEDMTIMDEKTLIEEIKETTASKCAEYAPHGFSMQAVTPNEPSVGLFSQGYTNDVLWSLDQEDEVE